MAYQDPRTSRRGESSRTQNNNHQHMQARIDDTFEDRERRHRAAKVLESSEMLIWHAMQKNEVCGTTVRC